MGQRGGSAEWVQVAARIFVEDSLTSYAIAKRKAAERMGISSRQGVPDNARIETEVIAYQQLFGGEAYRARLQLLRATAVRAMQLLAEFEPRLVGATVTGAITDAHRVQLHAFPAKPELLDVFLAERRIKLREDERDYRWPNGQTRSIPLACFEATEVGVGVDVALFAPGDERSAPCSPVDGRPMKRLNLAAAEALLSRR